MNERIRRLYDLVSEDIALQAELNDVVSGVEFTRDEAVMRRNMADALVGFAKAHGLDLAAEDFAAPATEGAISDEELAGVAGGAAAVDPLGALLASLKMSIYTDGQAPTEFWR